LGWGGGGGKRKIYHHWQRGSGMTNVPFNMWGVSRPPVRKKGAWVGKGRDRNLLEARGGFKPQASALWRRMGGMSVLVC